MSDALVQTNPRCLSSTHGSRRAADRGCLCAEAIVAKRERLAQQARSAASRVSKTISPAVSDREPDFVEVHLVITRQKRFKQVERDVDRAAIVHYLAADGLSIGAIAYRLGAWAGTVERLLRVSVAA